jgi:hypothetical protein
MRDGVKTYFRHFVPLYPLSNNRCGTFSLGALIKHVLFSSCTSSLKCERSPKLQIEFDKAPYGKSTFEDLFSFSFSWELNWSNTNFVQGKFLRDFREMLHGALYTPYLYGYCLSSVCLTETG